MLFTTAVLCAPFLNSRLLAILQPDTKPIRHRCLLRFARFLPFSTTGMAPKNMEDITSSTRGALIVLEGCDRSGKTTQSKLLVENLQKRGHTIEFMRFPNRDTPIGHEIDEYMKGNIKLPNEQIHLMFSRNRWEQNEYMREQLSRGTSLIVDRYAYSGVVYSVAKGLSLAWCKSPDVGLPQPDAVLFLDLSPDQAAQRSGYGEEIYERREFQQKVYDTYMQMIAEEKEEGRWKVINADQSVESLASELLKASVSTITNVQNDIGVLWPNCKLADDTSVPDTSS